MRAKTRSLLAVLLSLALLLAACSGGAGTDGDRSTDGEQSSQGEPPSGGDGRKVLTVAALAEPETIYPNLTEGTWEELIEAQLFAAMIEVSPNYEILPGIAESWEWDESTLTYTFHLRDDVYFHDGEKLTAEDVIWTLKYAMHPDYDGVRYTLYQNIAGAEEYRSGQADDVAGLSAPDERTVKIQLKEKDASALIYVAGTGILPKHVYEPYVQQHGIPALRGAHKDIKPIGSGPFKFKEWKPGEWIVLEKNEQFYRDESEVTHEGQVTVPKMDELRIRFIPDADAAFRALQSGEVDIVGQVSTSQFKIAQNDPNLQAIQHPWLAYDFLMFNLRDEKFQDVRVRRAIGHAINRQEMIEVALEGLGTVAPGGHSHPIMWDYNEEVAAEHPTYDPKKVIELMEAAGWTIEKDEQGNIRPGALWMKNGEPFSFELATNHPNPRRADFQQYIQLALRDLGFDVSLRVMDPNTFYYDYLAGDEWDTAIAGWRLGADPAGAFEDLFGCDRTPDKQGWNWPYYYAKGPDGTDIVTQLDRQARQLMGGQEEQEEVQRQRAEIYQQINEILVRDVPYIWLAFPDGLLVAKKGLTGIEPVHPSAYHSDFWRYDWE